MEYKTILNERHGAIAKLIMNRPRYRNAQSRLMIEELDMPSQPRIMTMMSA